MKLFKKREAPLSRRSMRLWLLRFRKVGIVMIAVGVIAGAGVSCWNNGTFGKIQNWAHEKTLTVTAGMGFKVKDIIITGRNRVSAPELLDALGIKQGDPIFDADIATAQLALSEISWVKDVSVTRRLPDAIHIELTERQPVALWQYQKKISVIDVNGRALTAKNLEKYRDLPLVVGETAPLHVGPLLDLLRAEPVIANQLASASRIGGRRWDLRLKNGVIVKLPEKDTELALRKLAEGAETDGLFDKNILGIDLRIPDQMVVDAVTSAPVKKTI